MNTAAEKYCKWQKQEIKSEGKWSPTDGVNCGGCEEESIKVCKSY